jgi:hypothetical protein
VLGRIVLLVVHTQDDGHVRALGRGGDDHLLCSGLDVFRCAISRREDAGGLEHDVHAEILPRQLRRILHREDLELVLGHGDPVAGRFHVRLEVAEDRVVLEEMRQGLGVGEIVDGNEVDVRRAQRRAHDVAANAPKPVDTDPNRHHVPPMRARQSPRSTDS